MATYGWRETSSVEEWLFEEGYRFDFFQAIKLLEKIHSNRVPIGEGSEANKEAVAISSSIDLEFPASDVAEAINRKDSTVPTGLKVNFFGLAGSVGPLPKPFTELVLERLHDKDTSLRDFLDIFNHRLLSLFFRARKNHRLALEKSAPGEDAVSDYLYSMIGLGTSGLREQLRVSERSVLPYAGLLAHGPRSLIGLERLLSDYFRMPVKGQQLCGRWYELDEEQQTAIGLTGRNQRLGVDAVVVGKRVWDQQTKFELAVGPLTFKQFLDLLPIGRAFTPLCDLTKFYVDDQCDFTFNLILKSSEVPGTVLSRQGNSRLSWTSWLRTKPASKDETQVVTSPKSINSFPVSFKIPAFSGLPLLEQSDLMDKMFIRAFKPNTVVIRQDFPVDSIFIIRKGEVRILQHDSVGKDETVILLGPDDFFGEISPDPDRTKISNYTVVTTRVCEVLELRGKDLIDVFNRHPQIKNSLRRQCINQFPVAGQTRPKTRASVNGSGI